MNFLHLVHLEDMSHKSLSAKEVFEALLAPSIKGNKIIVIVIKAIIIIMVSACQICIPKGSIMTPTTRAMTVRETYAQCLVLSNKACCVC